MIFKKGHFMFFNIITFFLLLLCLYLAILYQSMAACALFLFLSICSILELALLLYNYRHLELNLPDILVNDGSKKDTLSFTLHAKNTGIFPIPYICLKWHFIDGFQNKILLPDYCFMLNAKKSIVFSGEITNTYCGKFQLQIKKVKMYGLTHLLSLKFSATATADALFYPKPFLIPIQVSEKMHYFSAECDDFEEIVSGIGQYNSSDIRDFAPGDKLKQIHWKLSARTDKLLVKETGKSNGFPILLFLEKNRTDKKSSPQKYTNFLKCAASLSYSFLYHGCNHFVIWYSREEKRILRVPVRTEEDYISFLHQLLYDTLDSSEENLSSLYSITYPCDTYFSSFLLDTDLRLYQNQQFLLSCAEKNSITALKNFNIVI